MECYYHMTACTDPYRNLALEELLFRQIKPNRVLLYLWQNENTVVIGRNQNAWRECRLEAFTAQEGRLARRLSGGGAVYHDLGNQNFTFMAEQSLFDVERQTEVLRLAIQEFGIEAMQSGRNDILAQGRKFSGNAFHHSAQGSFQHGTILISSDLSKLSQFLAPSPEKLASKGVESVRARVLNLCELNESITPQAMREALLHAFAVVYGMIPKPFPLDEVNSASLDELTEQYASEDWRLGRLSAFTSELRHRFTFGELEFLLEVSHGTVKTAQIHSDAIDADWIKKMEEAFIGKAFTATALSNAVPISLHNPQDRAEVVNFLSANL